jgi:MoaA/NifB/PqqE/SkfB family radical SAM enzyme
MKSIFITSNISSLKKVAIWYILNIKGKVSPLIANYYITNNCNFRCSFCRIWKDKKKSTVRFVKFKKAVDALSKKVLNFVITGGEPFTCPEILKFISYSSEKCERITIFTNGSLINRKIIKKLPNRSNIEISFSIDSLSDKHDKNRGFKGVVKQVLYNIVLLKILKEKIHPFLLCIISPENVDECLELITLSELLNIKIFFQAINRPIDTNPLTSKKIKPYFKKFTKQQILKLIDFCIFATKKNNVANSPYYLLSLTLYFIGEKVGIQIKKYCDFPRYKVEISNTGEIFPCILGSNWQNGMQYKHSNFLNLLESKQYKKRVYEMEKECTFCQSNFFLCHIESNILFPYINFLKYYFLETKIIKIRLYFLKKV